MRGEHLDRGRAATVETSSARRARPAPRARRRARTLDEQMATAERAIERDPKQRAAEQRAAAHGRAVAAAWRARRAAE